MLCRPFHGLDGPPTLTWGSAFSSTPGFMLPPAPRAKTCHMPLDKTSNNLVNDVLNTALTILFGIFPASACNCAYVKVTYGTVPGAVATPAPLTRSLPLPVPYRLPDCI